MAILKNKNQNLDNLYFNLAFEKAKINLGHTGLNPSVGCVVVKDNSVISSGNTSRNGRPHAEFQALKSNINFKDTDIYVTMEPCAHYGLTPPCTNIIIKKGVKRVFYKFDDVNKITAGKAKKFLSSKGVSLIKKKTAYKYNNFYKSYFNLHKNNIPFIDAKIAISKDFFTINKDSKWITNTSSRKWAHLIRSNYDCIISTSKSINADNSLLNCRLNGFNQNKPDLVIVDLKLNIKKNINLFKLNNNRKIFIVTSITKNKKKTFLKKMGVKFIMIKTLKKKIDFIHFFKILSKYKYNRILVEAGLIFLNELLKKKFIFNIYIFQSINKLGYKGSNNTSNSLIKNINFKKRIKVNLDGDKLYEVKLK